MNQTILRNLFYTLKRFRTASFLNLLGLSAAFAAFIVIMMKTRYEQQFDTCYPEPPLTGKTTSWWWCLARL